MSAKLDRSIASHPRRAKYPDWLPKDGHSAVIAGATGCGKTEFVLDLLEGPYKDYFKTIIILCPSIRHNKAYRGRPWLWETSPAGSPVVYMANPGGRLHDYLRVLYEIFQGKPTLYIIDDMSAEAALTKKKDMLSELAFSGRHAEQSVWVLSQRYNSVLKDLREQTRWVALFHMKDSYSFHDCLRENDVIRSPEEVANVRNQLAETKHSVLLLKTDSPSEYVIL